MRAKTARMRTVAVRIRFIRYERPTSAYMRWLDSSRWANDALTAKNSYVSLKHFAGKLFCFSDCAAGDDADHYKNAEADGDADAYLSCSGKAIIAEFVYLGIGDTCRLRGTLLGDLKGVRVDGDKNSFDHRSVDFGDFDTLSNAASDELLVENGSFDRSGCNG